MYDATHSEHDYCAGTDASGCGVKTQYVTEDGRVLCKFHATGLCAADDCKTVGDHDGLCAYHNEFD